MMIKGWNISTNLHKPLLHRHECQLQLTRVPGRRAQHLGAQGALRREASLRRGEGEGDYDDIGNDNDMLFDPQ